MQAASDRQADELASRLGVSLKDARTRRGITQREAAAMAGLSASAWSWLEVGRDGRVTLATMNRAANAMGTSLAAYLKDLSSASLPRDAVHLRHQELVIRTAQRGGWQPLPEERIDRDARTSRAADVLLVRRSTGQPTCYALVEIWDWLADVGAAVRDWTRRMDAVDRYAVSRMTNDDRPPLVAGFWVLRATQRNQELVSDHHSFFNARFPQAGQTWLDALEDRQSAMPSQSALVWVTVKGDRLFPARL